MNRISKQGVLILALLLDVGTPSFPISKNLSPDQLKEAVAFGSQWKSNDKFLTEGMKAYKFQISSAWSTDGISKYVTFLTDWINVAAASTAANRQMRTLTAGDLEKIPRPGLVSAVVEIHGRGMLGASRAGKRFADGRAHLVLKIGNEIIQPLDASSISDEHTYGGALWVFVGQTYGNLGWVIGGPAVQYQERKMVLKFSYQLTEGQMNGPAEVILIDGDGRHHTTRVDLSKLK